MRFAEYPDSQPALPIGTFSWMNGPLNGGLRPGGCYIVGGEPGGCKTTLCLQMVISLARSGVRVLLILTEQSPAEVASIIKRLCRGFSSRAVRSVWKNVQYEVLNSPDDLARCIIPRLERDYRGVKVVVVDSVQGSGLPGTATRAYAQVFSLIDRTKALGISCILVSHFTKNNRLSGPRAFEHKGDCLILLRKAFSLRHLFVAKNRFGPELVDPLALELIDGRLKPSPHQGEHSAVVLGYDARNDELLELQAGVSLPKLGRRGELNAPFLPTRRLRLLLSILSRLPGIDLSDLTYTLNAYVPAGFFYSGELDLPLAIAMLGAYLRRPIPANTLFVGQVDLRRQVRPPTAAYMQSLTQVLGTQLLAGIRHIVFSSAAAGLIMDSLPSSSRLKVSSVATLDELIGLIWPDLYVRPAAKPVKAGSMDDGGRPS